MGETDRHWVGNEVISFRYTNKKNPVYLRKFSQGLGPKCELIQVTLSAHARIVQGPILTDKKASQIMLLSKKGQINTQICRHRSLFLLM